jgi:hypothetical protein
VVACQRRSHFAYRIENNEGQERLQTIAALRTRELGNIVTGVFTPVLARHSKSFSLINCISVGVDRMQRNFEPMRKQVEGWQRSKLMDVTAKVVIYEAFVEGRRKLPNILPASCMTFTSYVAQRFMWRPPREAHKDGSITADQRHIIVE